MDINIVAIIRISIGLTMLAFGLNQLKDPKEWLGYIPRSLAKLVPERRTIAFMRVHAAINVALGILYATGAWDTPVAWLTFVWWLSILPFVFVYNWKIGMRDFAIVVTTLAVALALS